MNEQELKPIYKGLLSEYWGSFIFVGVFVLLFYNMDALRKLGK